MKRQAWKRMQAWLLVVAMLVSVVTGIGTTKTAKAATKMGVTYTVHVQTYGDQQGWVHDGTMAGTKGQAKRLEEIRVKLTGDEYSGSIQYKTHIQSYGWQDWSYNGEKSGSRGQAKRLEGIEIQLTGRSGKTLRCCISCALSDLWLDGLGEERCHGWNERTGKTIRGHRD